MEVIKQQKNPFLNREEIFIKIKSNSTPTAEEIKKELKKDEELTVVKKIEGGFGRKTFNVEVFVYDSKKAKDEIEKIPRKIRKKLEEEAKEKGEQK